MKCPSQRKRLRGAVALAGLAEGSPFSRMRYAAFRAVPPQHGGGAEAAGIDNCGRAEDVCGPYGAWLADVRSCVPSQNGVLQRLQIGNTLIVVALLLGACDGGDSATTKPPKASKMSPKSHIPRAQLQQMFDGIRQTSKWDIDGNMLWGYFFADTQRDRLKRAQRDLEAQGYRFVDMFETERDGEPSGVFMLHVERVETHTVDSLDTRNGELDALAARHGLQSYDGMDVGPATQPATRPSAADPQG